MSENEVSEWIARAEQDFLAATQLDPDVTAAVVCSLCHQCIEKYLKALMIQRGLAPSRIHDLIALARGAADVEPAVKQLEPQLAVLNPYAVDVRYPGLTTTSSDAEVALIIMQQLRTDLRNLLGCHD
jgi:HEPN domain-containing protein